MMKLQPNDLQKKGKGSAVWLHADKRRTEALENKPNGLYKEVNADFARWFDAANSEAASEKHLLVIVSD